MLKHFELPKQREYLLQLSADNFSDKTIKNYKRDLSVFALFLQKEGLDFDKVNKRTITLYKSFLQAKEYLTFLKYLQENKSTEVSEIMIGVQKLTGDNKQGVYRGRYGYGTAPKEGLQARSCNRFLSSLRSYLKFCIDFDYPVPIPPDAIKLIKTERVVSQVAEFSELIKLIEAPETIEHDDRIKLRNRAILEVLFATGLRVSELVSLDRDQVDKQGRIYVLGKGKKGRFVYLTPRAIQWINKYLETRKDDKNAMFIPYRGGRNGKTGERVSTNYIEEKISEYRTKLGIIVPTTPHSLRHGFATYLSEGGASPAAIQTLLGHSSLNTTTRYVHTSDKFAQESHKKFHPLAK